MRFTDGIHLLKIYEHYVKSTSVLSKAYPEISASALSCILSDTSTRSNIRAVINLIKLFLNSLFVYKVSYPKCDVILFNSSNKPSFGPAINELAMRLTRKGYSCGIISYDKITTIGYDGSQVISNLDSFYAARGFIHFISAAFRALIVSFKIQYVLVRENSVFFAYYLRRSLPNYYSLLISYIRSSHVDVFYECTKAKLLITHIEKIPIANELVMASDRNGVYTILFLCEHPDIMTQPIYSREIWVWNNDFADSVLYETSLFNKKIDKKLYIVGHYESDYILSLRNNKPIDYRFPITSLRNRKIFLFISELVENSTWQRKPITGECVNWLKIAAKSLPDWLFIFKTRPYQNTTVVPGFDGSLQDLPENLVLYNGEQGLPQFLAYGDITAAGALGSLGLFAAAHCGIPCFRFIVSDPHMHMTFLDDFALKIYNPSDLTANLKSIDIHQNKLNSKLSTLSFRSQSMDRMEQLTVNRLIEYMT
jgi:hypothetical protein